MRIDLLTHNYIKSSVIACKHTPDQYSRSFKLIVTYNYRFARTFVPGEGVTLKIGPLYSPY